MTSFESIRDPGRVWQRAREGLPTAVLGRLPEPPRDLEVVRVRCDGEDPLAEARRLTLALLGEEQGAGRKPARRRGAAKDAARGEALAELWARLGADRVVVFEAAEAAQAAEVAVLVKIIAAGEGRGLPLVLELAAEDGAAELVAAVGTYAGAGALLRFEAPPPWRTLPLEALRVLRAAALVGPGFRVEEVAALLRVEPLAVLEGLQAAADVGVAVEDRGERRIALPEALGVELGATLLPSLADGWRARLVALRAVEVDAVAAEAAGAGRGEVSEGTGAEGGADGEAQAAVAEQDVPGAAETGAEGEQDEVSEGTGAEGAQGEALAGGEAEIVEVSEGSGAEGGRGEVGEAEIGEVSEEAGAEVGEAEIGEVSVGTGVEGEAVIVEVSEGTGAAIEGGGAEIGEVSEETGPAIEASGGTGEGGEVLDAAGEVSGGTGGGEVEIGGEELEEGDVEVVDEAAWQSGSMFARVQPRGRGGAQPPRLRPKPPRFAALSTAATSRYESRMPTRNPALDVAARLRGVATPMQEPVNEEARAAEALQDAGDIDGGAARLCRAAREAAEAGSPKLAVEHAQRALALLQGQAATVERRRLKGLALLELGQLQWQSAGPEMGFTLAQALKTLDLAAAELGHDATTELAVQLCRAIAGVCFELGDMRSLERALQELTAASRMLHADGDATGAAGLLNDQAAVLVRIGDPVQALQLLKESRKVFQARSDEDPVALRELAETDHLFAALPLNAEMRPGRALEGYRMGHVHAQKAERSFRQLGDARELGRVWETMGRLELRMEQLETATKHLEAAADVQMQLGDLTGLARTTEALSEALGLRGRDAEAVALLRDSVQYNRNKGSPMGLAVNRRVFTALAERLGADPLHASALREVEVLLAAGERELGAIDAPAE